MPEERYSMMAAAYEQEQAALKQKTASFQSEIKAFNDDSMKAENFLEIVRQYTHIGELSNAMINEFVDKIIIHESVWTEQTETERRKGERTQKIEVFLRYIADFDAPDMRSAEEIESERIALEKAERKRKQKRDSERRRREKRRAGIIAAEKAKPETETSPHDPDPITETEPAKTKPAA